MTEPLPSLKPRILCVDDEPQVLEALTMNLRRHFRVQTAASGAEGLQKIDTQGADPYVVIVSDMRMPAMDGAEFLSQARKASPDAVRMLLTGYSEVESAILAVNEGQIFRFLTKPCPPDALIAAVRSAVEQHRLITAERVLLEQTLRGAVRALTEILSFQSPAAFGRAMRAKNHVATLAGNLKLEPRWALELAAMLWPIGMMTLPHDTVERLMAGRPLTSAEDAMVKRLPELTEQLLGGIPRLELVREILNHLSDPFEAPGGARPGPPPLGSRLLKIVLDYDTLESQGLRSDLALDTLASRRGMYDPELLGAFASLLGNSLVQAETLELPLAELRSGMVFLEDVRSKGGALLVARGHEISGSLLARIRNVAHNSAIAEPLKVLVPPHIKRTGMR